MVEMKYILTAWLAIGFALCWNRILSYLKIKDTIRLGMIIPISEEIFKFSVSYYFHLAPFLIYALFGLGEGIFETIHLKKKPKLTALLAGVLTHSFFSIFFLLDIPVFLGLAMAMISHLIWNQMILNLHSI